MRKNSLMLIAAIIAVVALTVSIPVLLSGCGDDDTAARGRNAQKVQERDDSADQDRSGQGGRGMARQDKGEYLLDTRGGCIRNVEGRSDAPCEGPECARARDGECDAECGAECEEASAGACRGYCAGFGMTDDEPFGSEPICF